jgi:lycopene cyclase domain-containing protein
MPVYLYLIIFTLFFPLVLSFDKNVRFFSNWKFFFPSTIIPAFLFLFWDYWFTEAGVWGFNPEYLIGIYFMNLPVEEILFFLVVPFACVFIYECLNFYISTDFLKPVANTISVSLITLLFTLGFLNSEKLYTAVNFFATGILLFIVLVFIKPKFIGRFYLAYLVSLIPFLLVNGILTYLPVVWYNDAHNLGIRIISIPVEDFIYTLLKLLSYTLMYDWVKSKFSNKVNLSAA